MSLQTVADKMAPGSGAAHFTAVFADPNVPINLYSKFFSETLLDILRLPLSCAAIMPLFACAGERAARGDYGGTLWGTATVGISPFGRSQNFSKPISDYSKVMDPEWPPMAAGE